MKAIDDHSKNRNLDNGQELAPKRVPTDKRLRRRQLNRSGLFTHRRPRLKVHVAFLCAMSDRPASWRMPNPKQMEKLAADASRITLSEPEAGSEMPEEYWQAVFADPRLQGSRGGRAQPSVAPGQVLRIDCRRCNRPDRNSNGRCVAALWAERQCRRGRPKGSWRRLRDAYRPP